MLRVRAVACAGAVRRFFFVDGSLGTVQSNPQQPSDFKVVQFPSSMQFAITVNGDDTNQLMPPVLNLKCVCSAHAAPPRLAPTSAPPAPLRPPLHELRSAPAALPAPRTKDDHQREAGLWEWLRACCARVCVCWTLHLFEHSAGPDPSYREYQMSRSKASEPKAHEAGAETRRVCVCVCVRACVRVPRRYSSQQVVFTSGGTLVDDGTSSVYCVFSATYQNPDSLNSRFWYAWRIMLIVFETVIAFPLLVWRLYQYMRKRRGDQADQVRAAC